MCSLGLGLHLDLVFSVLKPLHMKFYDILDQIEFVRKSSSERTGRTGGLFPRDAMKLDCFKFLSGTERFLVNIIATIFRALSFSFHSSKYKYSVRDWSVHCRRVIMVSKSSSVEKLAVLSA